ncbi:MAG TPA: CvpA family protein [Patescibacteria group bacterium]|nr:CvpA family protein [Patescibacteria group bacterium]
MIPSLNGNWVDLVIILILGYYVWQAFRFGFWGIIADFASFFGSLLISLRTYKFAGAIIKSNFNLTPSFNNALGFIVTSILAEIALGYLFLYLLAKIPKKILQNKYNKFLGLIPALGEALVLIAFLLTSITALPVRPQIKMAVSESKIGGLILKETSGLEKIINTVFGGAINDTLTYFTVEPKSNATVKLTNTKDTLSYDHEAETQMFADVNHERASRGIGELTWSPKIVGVAEAYATDMWHRHYFSHYNPEGKTLADRFKSAGIEYNVAGENLALAPTEATAMNGLMNSPEHKANILDKEFHKIGIGVVDNGINGKIFVQEFTD